MRKTTILSTIKLNATHVEMFSENNIELLQYNFIKILAIYFFTTVFIIFLYKTLNS